MGDDLVGDDLLERWVLSNSYVWSLDLTTLF